MGQELGSDAIVNPYDEGRVRLPLQFHELNKVAHGVIKNSDDGRPDIGGLHGELHALVTELLIFGFHIGGQELRDRNTVRLECCGIVFGGGMALRFQKQLGISLTFSIGNSKPPKSSVSYVILDSEAKGIDVKVVSAGNAVYGDGSDIYICMLAILVRLRASSKSASPFQGRRGIVQPPCALGWGEKYYRCG